MPKRKAPESHDESVARIALDRLTGEAKAVAGMRGLPPELRYTTDEEELALYNEWDDKVDPVVVMQERFAKHTADGLPPEMAMAEAIVETCAAGFANRLKLAGAQGRLSLSEQTRYLESMAMKSRRAKEKASSEMTPDSAFGDHADQSLADSVATGDGSARQGMSGTQGEDL